MSEIAAAAFCPFCMAGRTMARDERTAYFCGTQYQGKGIYRRTVRCEAEREKNQLQHDLDQVQKQRELDEARTTCIDALPKLWWGLFRGCMEEGFTSEQALALVQTFIAKPLG